MKPFTRTEKILLLAVALSVAVAILIPLASFVAGKEAREENCENTRQAFEAYTEALAQVTDAAEVTVREFKDAYTPQLEECH